MSSLLLFYFGVNAVRNNTASTPNKPPIIKPKTTVKAFLGLLHVIGTATSLKKLKALNSIERSILSASSIAILALTCCKSGTKKLKSSMDSRAAIFSAKAL